MPRYAAQIGSTLTGLRRTHAADLGNVGSEELLVDEGWHAVEVEPEVLVAHRNGAAVTVEIEAANGQGSRRYGLRSQR